MDAKAAKAIMSSIIKERKLVGYENGYKDGYKQGLITALGILKTSEWPQMYVYINEIEMEPEKLE